MRKWLRRLAKFLGGLLVLFAILVGVARACFHGERLGDFLEKNVLNDGIRGRVELGSVDWRLVDLVTFRREWSVEVTNVKVFDPGGKQVLDLPRVRARIDVWSAAFGRHDLLLDQVVVEGGTALVEEYETPGGLHPSEIGLLAAFGSKRPPSDSERRSPGSVMHVRHLDLRDIDLGLHFLAWKVDLEDLDAAGTLKNDGSAEDPAKRHFTYDILPRAPKGTIDVGTMHFDVVDLATTKFGQLPDRPDAWVFDLTAKTGEEAKIHVAGELNDLYNPSDTGGGVILDVTVEHAGGLADRLSEHKVGGQALTARARLEGPMAGPKLTVTATGAETSYDGQAILVGKVEAALDLATQQGVLGAIEVAALGGAARAQGTFAIDPPGGDVTIEIPEELDLRPWLPPDVVKVTGGTRLRGTVHASGTLADLTAELRRVRLGGALANGAIRKLGDEVRTEGLTVELPDGGATVRGRADLEKRQLRLEFRASLTRLAKYLHRFGAPRVATSFDASGSVTGRFDALEVAARARVHGVPATGTVNIDLDYSHALRRLDLARITAKPLGGALKGSARLRFGRRLEILESSLSAGALNLANIPGITGVGGRVDLDLGAKGTLGGKFTASITASGESLIFDRYDLGSATLRASADEKGVEVGTFRIGPSGGWSGALSGRLGLLPGKLELDETIALKLDVSSLPLAMLAPPSLNVTGTLSADTKVTGTLTTPVIAGTVDLSGFGVRESLYGAARLEVEPWPDNRLHVSGKLFQGKLAVDATVALAPMAIVGRLSFKRVELDEFFPQLEETIPAHGWVSGFVDVDLAFDRNGRPVGGQLPDRCAQLHITEARLLLDREDERGRPVPLVVENVERKIRREIVVDWNCKTQTATLAQPIVLASGADVLTVAGKASPQRLELTVDGNVRLELLQFYLSRWLKQVSGVTRMNARITGTIDRPVVEGRIGFREAKLYAHGQDVPLQIPSGSIKFANNGVWIEDAIHIIVGNEKLEIGGMIAMNDFVPAKVDVGMKGRLPGKLLEFFAPRYFSDSGGAARAALKVTGDALSPQIDGTISFDRENPLMLAPRGLRRVISRIQLDRGKIALNNREIAFVGVRGNLDEASLTLDGTVGLFNPSQRLFDVDVLDIDLYAQLGGFTYNHTGVLALEVGADLHLYGDRNELRLAAGRTGRAMQIVAGRFYQKFLLTDAFVPERTAERSEPIWKGIPVLEHLVLEDLRVETSGNFRVDNNIAKIPFKGNVVVGGTFSKPTFQGQFEAEGGTLTPPLFRVKQFSLTEGTIRFSEIKKFPDQTPDITVRAEGDYIDPSGTNHRVTLELNGNLERFEYDLWTNTGLGRAETTSLILIGRTTEDVRAKVRGDTSDASETDQAASAPGGGTRTSGIASAGDQIIKDLTGELLGVFIADPIRDALGGLVDTVRIGIGTDSFQAGFGKKLGRIVSFNGEYEQGYRGWSRGVISVDLKFVDNFFAVGKYVSYKPEQQTEEDEDSWRFQFSFRFVVP